jgi:hypothetical protein
MATEFRLADASTASVNQVLEGIAARIEADGLVPFLAGDHTDEIDLFSKSRENA